MTKHTDGVERAVEKIADLFGIQHRRSWTPYNRNARIATIIDQETGLPEITAARNMLSKAHQAISSLPNGESVWTARKISRAALASESRLSGDKEPESGEKEKK